jgi:hypothetical protein
MKGIEQLSFEMETSLAVCEILQEFKASSRNKVICVLTEVNVTP